MKQKARKRLAKRKRRIHFLRESKHERRALWCEILSNWVNAIKAGEMSSIMACYTSQEESPILQNMFNEQALYKRDDFEAYYQEIFDLAEGNQVTVEFERMQNRMNQTGLEGVYAFKFKDNDERLHVFRAAFSFSFNESNNKIKHHLSNVVGMRYKP